MTTPSEDLDVEGLVERLKRSQLSATFAALWALCDQAATSLQSLQSRLRKAEGERDDARACEEIVIELREQAARVTGGNCTGADDDVAVLAHLADRAVKAGLTDQLHWQVQKHAADREERAKYRTAEGIVALILRAQDAEAALQASQSEAAALRVERDEARAKLNLPEVRDFLAGVTQEAAHQRARWGAAHDAGKEPEDWFWLLGWLAGKAVKAARSGDVDKARHHTISSAAALANWHAALTGESTAMRPGTDADERGYVEG